MDEPIMVVTADSAGCHELCADLQRRHYRTIVLHSLSDVAREMQTNLSPAVILDLDSLPVDNRFIKDLRRKNPEGCVIGLSSRTFHPELEEAMRSHISACLGKPVDIEELIYWLRSVCGKEPNTRDSPVDQ